MVCFGLQRYAFYLNWKRKTIIFYDTDGLDLSSIDKGILKGRADRKDLQYPHCICPIE